MKPKEPEPEPPKVKIETVEGVEIRCGLNHTIISLNNNEHVFVLGCYDRGSQSQDDICTTPQLLSLGEQYKIIKFDTEKHKTVIVAEKKET